VGYIGVSGLGDHWDALIDLWTEEEGSSDLVLQVHVSEVSGKPFVTVYMVYYMVYIP
jgi:hypothetical protein